jgi:UDP-N-acetylglucosamine--N-acetylmuramyl-(pentapeptide) pyrophosphoryl-undecaprenol N-acetylglucosamine transferase
MNKKIIFTTGGSGGHIFPAINLMKYFSKKGYKILLVTDKRGKNFINNYSSHRSIIINTSSPTNKNYFKKIISYIIIFFAILKSFFLIIKEKPNLIFGLGGYVSFPISFASKFFKVPLIIYENNMTLGRANKKLLPIAKKIILTFKTPINLNKRYYDKIFYSGNILSEDIINYSIKEKNIDNKYFSILILGGSQGAEIFGRIIPPAIKMIKDKGYEIKIFQQCILSQKNSIIEFYNSNLIKNNIFIFSNNILNLMTSCDLAISRSGASTTAELTKTLTPFVAVPLPQSIDNHQYLNANYYKEKGCCWIIEQNNFTTINLFNFLMDILKNKKKLIDIKLNMKKNDNGNSYNKIETLIEGLI